MDWRKTGQPTKHVESILVTCISIIEAYRKYGKEISGLTVFYRPGFVTPPTCGEVLVKGVQVEVFEQEPEQEQDEAPATEGLRYKVQIFEKKAPAASGAARC
jgi:hypothetical protein